MYQKRKKWSIGFEKKLKKKQNIFSFLFRIRQEVMVLKEQEALFTGFSTAPLAPYPA